ncbi:hypothetical protein GQ600_14783 [Phytophthora cactorum]|nr:hypothetical protein GQ600_14783 [Phytophthora cactorum]
MSLRAAFPLSTGMTAPMNLVLDGRIRVFRALPSGISSRIAVGGWSVGTVCSARALAWKCRKCRLRSSGAVESVELDVNTRSSGGLRRTLT